MLSDAVLSAITEAVFGYLLEQTPLGERVRTWLHRDPQHLAFQVALTRANPFARHYPQWEAALLDTPPSRPLMSVSRTWTPGVEGEPAACCTTWSKLRPICLTPGHNMLGQRRFW